VVRKPYLVFCRRALLGDRQAMRRIAWRGQCVIRRQFWRTRNREMPAGSAHITRTRGKCRDPTQASVNRSNRSCRFIRLVHCGCATSEMWRASIHFSNQFVSWLGSTKPYPSVRPGAQNGVKRRHSFRGHGA
jgi:hypothetical protein